MSEDFCWVMTTGEAGMRSQAIGLAEAVGLPFQEKRIALRKAWHFVPGGVLPMPLAALSPAGDGLAPPWPRLVIACGRRSIDAALMVKRLSGGRSIAAYVQNAKLATGKFDLVAAMPHDRLTGSNVVVMPTALHGITKAKLDAAREVWRERLMSDGAPLLGVLIGGDNASYRLTDAVTDRLIRILRTAHETHGMRAFITPSRRTGTAAKQRLAEALAAEPFGALWDERGDNPYLGILALADRLIVTSESISMVSEALATGRPVHTLPLEGRGARHEAFLRDAAAKGLISPISGDDLDWTFQGKPPIYSATEPAQRLRALLGLAGED